MAKILVADDNSNVQKTVALALAGLGVDVISVNNGEAAVRKLADVSPDLVLADIFMPVRNGYEVCEYVKKDNRFAHVPVVLLVGAFDPLDEREAQRVGADGILKKPFVPPDPLITMVKTLLERTMGERLVSVSVSKLSAASAGRSTGAAIAEEHSPSSDTSEETSTQAPSISDGRVSFGGGEHPVAFSQLLAAPEQDAIAPASDVIEPVDNDQILTSSRDATLGDPIFWQNDAPEPEKPEAAEAPEDPEELSAALDLRAWKQGEDSLPRREDALLLQPIDPLELVRDGQEESTQTVVDSKSILLDQAAQAPLHVESDIAPELAANPIEWMANAPPEHAEETAEVTPRWDDPLPEAAEGIKEVELTERAHNEAAISWSAPEKPSAPISSSVESPVAESVESSHVSPIAASAASPVASAILSPVAPAVSAPSEEKHEEKLSEPVKTVPPATQSLLQSAEETAQSIRKQDWADMTAELDSRISIIEPLRDTQRLKPDSLLRALQSRLSEPAKEQSKPVPVPVALQPATSGSNSIQEHIEPAATVPTAAVGSSLPASANPPPGPTPDPVLVEAVVQRVLDKMRPQVVDIITKEFLRPIVQALVHREIEKH